MYRLLLLLSVAAIAAVAPPAQAFRFPETGKHAFQVNLPPGWKTTVDTRGGMLLVPPDNHAMVYIAILVDDTLRGQPISAVAEAVAKIAGIKQIERLEPAQLSDLPGTAFYGEIAVKPRYARQAKIVIVPLTPNTWAQEWIVTQPGMNAAQRHALAQVIDGIELTTGR